jgi:hypothetical protein
MLSPLAKRLTPTKRAMTFEQACARYVNRFTCDHAPAWAAKPFRNGKFPAPHYRSDREWYDRTRFAGESGCFSSTHCANYDKTWPLGESLDAPYRRR